MTEKPQSKIVIDSNVFVSSILFPDSTPYFAVAKAIEMGQILMSEEVAQELNAVIARKKFDRYRPSGLRLWLLREHMSAVTFIPITQTTQICRDPRDNKFLDLALSGHADILLTGDADLLSLHPFHKTAILSPSDFLVL